MTEPVQTASADDADLLRPASGLSLLGEYQGTGFTEPRFLVRRGDGQVIQLTRLLYAVTQAIADDAPDGGRDPDTVAARAGASFGRGLTADNIRYLVAGKLGPLGIVTAGPVAAGPPGQRQDGAAAPPRVNLLLGLKARGVLLRPPAVRAIGQALAWLHHPVLVAIALAAFAALEVWLFAVHGAIGPVLLVVGDPVLFLAVAGLTLVSLLFHEFGHASASRYSGAQPGVIGFGLYLIFPSLYTDVTDAYRLTRAGRLRVDLGGVYFNGLFVLALFGCYGATGNPAFLAAVFLDNFQILQQLFPLVRMDGYFILGDLAGVPDLLGLLGPIMASVLPKAVLPGTGLRDKASRAGARARGLRRGPRILVTGWVLVAIPLLGALTGYAIWNLPVMISTARQAFTIDVAQARAGFSGGNPAAGLVAVISVALLIIPGIGLAYLLAQVVMSGARALLRHRPRHWALALGVTGALAAAAAVAVVLVVVPTGSKPAGDTAAMAMASATSRSQAAAWVAQQVSPGVTVSCDPAMCQELRADGFPAARVRPLAPSAPDPLGSAMVIATPLIQDQFGPRLAADYAPQAIASFGSGDVEVDVREVAPDGAAAFGAQAAAERAFLVSAGRQVLGNQQIQPSAVAQAQLLTGQVDSRLLDILSVLANQMPVDVLAFPAAPGASAGVPLRAAQVSAAQPGAQAEIVAFLRAQQGTYQPASITVAAGPGGQPVVTVRFDALAPSSPGTPPG
jgi:putative peptide zinc metalloprotease protein